MFNPTSEQIKIKKKKELVFGFFWVATKKGKGTKELSEDYKLCQNIIVAVWMSGVFDSKCHKSQL